MLKKFILFISLIIFSSLASLLFAEIIPIKKPIQTKEEEEKKLLVDVLKPLPKPTEKKEIKKKEEQSEKKVVLKKEYFQGIILPKKKPLIAGSKITVTEINQNITAKKISQ